MAVRKTESRIPGGFSQANANKLGEASAMGGNNEFLFIAYLTGPLQIGSTLPFWNRYVAFVDDTKVNASINLQYVWDIKFKNSSGTIVFQTDITTISNTYEFNAENLPNPSILLSATKCEVSLKIPAINSNAVILEQDIQGLSFNIEDFITDPANNQGAIAIFGNLLATRKVANWLKSYIDAADSAFNTTLKIPTNVPAAIAYYSLLVNLPTLLRDRKLEKHLDSSTPYTFQDVSRPIGVGSMKPHILAMFLPTASNPNIDNIDANGPQYSTYLTYQKVAPNGVTEEDIFNDYQSLLTKEQKVDIYNLLRFPKSNIILCAFLINQLKNTRVSWSDETASQIKNNLFMIRTTCTEMHRGPRLGHLYSKTNFSKRIKGFSFSKVIQEILEAQGSAIQYETIRLKILDIRSGKPVKSAKIKRLIIQSSSLRIGEYKLEYDGSTVITTTDKSNFSYEFDETAFSGYAKEQKVQEALNELGYDNGTSDLTMGPVGIAQFKKYWEDRLEPTIVYDGTTPSNNEDKFDLILEEYLSHRKTDANGVLKIRVPRKLLEGRTLSIEVGFWEFPVFVESLKVPQTDTLTRQNNDGQATEFNISWVGHNPMPLINQQTSDWGDTINNNRHFGWKVDNGLPAGDLLYQSSYLKACVKLVVKDTTGAFISFDDNILGKHYDEQSYPYHFVLFGMQWCQPVWEPIPATALKKIDGFVHPQERYNGTTTVNNINDRKPTSLNSDFLNRNLPAICTRHYAGDETENTQYGEGRDYGMLVIGQNSRLESSYLNNSIVIKANFYPNNSAPRVDGGNKAHYGVDYYAVEGTTKAFALFGGKILFKNKDIGGYGNNILLKKDSYGAFYAHLVGSSINVNQNDLVLAGTHLAKCGRTYKLNDTDKYTQGSSHLHLEIVKNSSQTVAGNGYNQIERRLGNPKDIIENLTPNHDVDENLNLILNNKSTRLFPCDSSWPDNSSYNAGRCIIRDGERVTGQTRLNNVSKYCWASRNLHCPYIALLTNNNFLYQSQLTYLFEDDLNSNPPANEQYLNPNGIDGGWGNDSEAAIRRFREKHQNLIYNNTTIIDPYKNFALPQNATEWEEAPGTRANDPTAYVLNQHAPYPRTNLNRVDK